MKTKFFTFMICLAFGYSAFAQNDEDTMEGRMMLSIGVGGMNMKDMNEALEAGAYPTLNNVGWDWGFDIWISDERLHIIYDFSSHSRQAGSGNTTNYDAGDLNICVGYGVVQGKHLSIVPYLGLGAEFARLELIQKEDPAINTVGGYISNAPYSQNLDMWSMRGSLGTYVLWDFSFKNERSNFTLGLHAGYSPRLIKQQWKSAGGSKLDGMNVPGGVSANLVFGVGL